MRGYEDILIHASQGTAIMNAETIMTTELGLDRRAYNSPAYQTAIKHTFDLDQLVRLHAAQRRAVR